MLDLRTNLIPPLQYNNPTPSPMYKKKCPSTNCGCSRVYYNTILKGRILQHCRKYIEGAKVQLLDHCYHVLAETQSDCCGRYVFDAIPSSGYMYICVTLKSEYTPVLKEVFIKPCSVHYKDILISYEEANRCIGGVVITHSNHTPISSASILLYQLNDANRILCSYSCRSNSEGTFYFKNVPPGTYELFITQDGYLPYSEHIIVGVDNKCHNLTVCMHPQTLCFSGCIQGTITEKTTGFVLPHVDVLLFKEQPTLTHTPVIVALTKTNTYGMYLFSGLDKGTYFVMASGKSTDN